MWTINQWNNSMLYFGNALNEEFREKSAYKDKICIGKHTFYCNQETFGPSDVNHYDEIHMIGKKGSEIYTKSLIDVLSQVQKSPPQTVNFHPTGRSSTQRLQLPTGNSDQITPPSATTPSRPPLNTTRTSTIFKYAVSTFNRFSNLLN